MGDGKNVEQEICNKKQNLRMKVYDGKQKFVLTAKGLKSPWTNNS